MRKFIILVCFVVGAPAFAAGVFLDPLPKWAHDSLYSGTYLNIDQVMKDEGLTRFQAVEAQNHMRDLMRDQNLTADAAYIQGLARVRANQYESGWLKPAFTKHGDYVAVLDLDETLLVQWYATGPQGNFDIRDVIADTSAGLTSGTFVKFTPGAEGLVRRLHADPNCKGVAIFSAKEDSAALDIVNKWIFSDGKPAKDFIAAVFTRNHLVVGPKIWLPSKDLRIFDPDLKHVVMIDDNPARIVQPLVLIAQSKFDADLLQSARDTNNSVVVKHYNDTLSIAADSAIEAGQAADKMAIPFNQALLPYSYFGNRVFLSLAASFRSRRKAMEYTRLNPKLQEAVFIPAAN